MNEINYSLIAAVRIGKLERVKDLINQYGLSYSSQWGGGYVLLRNSIELNHTEISKLLLNSGSKVNSPTSKKKPSNTPLHFAVKNRSLEIVEMLLDREAKIDAENDQRSTPLFFAIKKCDLEMVQLLLRRGASLFGNKNGLRALHIAAEGGCSLIAENLLNHGANINAAVNPYFYLNPGFSALHFAVAKNNTDTIDLLLSRGANVDAVCAGMKTPIHIATQKEYLGAVKTLLKYKACVNSKTKEGFTPLHFASEKGNVELIKLLLCNNAEIDPTVNNKMTPLCVAIKGSHREAAKFLMDHGANVDAVDENGKTILYLAVETGLAMIVGDVLQHCPDKNIPSNKNSLKIAAKCSEKKYVTIVEKLLQYGFSVEPKDINDSSLLHNCVGMGYIKILEDLLQYGIDLSCNKDQNTLLHIAAKSRQAEVAKFLLTHGADVNATDKSGKPAIFYSTENSDVRTTEVLLLHGANLQKSPELLRVATKNVCKEMVELLLQNQFNIETTDVFGETALHLAAGNKFEECVGTLLINADIRAKAEEDNLKIVSILLEHGAFIEAKNMGGQTALHIACQFGKIEVVKLLLNLGSDINSLTNDNDTCFSLALKHGCIQPIEFLKSHLILLKAANLYTSKENLTQLRWYSNQMKIKNDQCAEEIQKLKLEKIGNKKVSYYDILTKNLNSLEKYARNEDIIRAFELNVYKLDFPIYANIIERNFKRGVQRCLLLEQAYESFKCYLKLPYDCAAQILSFLSDADLKNIIDLQ